MTSREREIRGQRQSRAIHFADVMVRQDAKTMAFFEGLRQQHGMSPARRVRLYDNTRPPL